jgi:hypothetical protein
MVLVQARQRFDPSGRNWIKEFNMKVSLKTAILAFVFVTCFPLLTVAAEGDPSNAEIQGGHSATWYDSGEPGHGLFVEVLSDSTSPTGKQMVVAWFAFIDGKQVWLLAQGDITVGENGEQALLDVFIYEGNDFPPFYDPDETESTPWGTMLLYFRGCNDAHLEWDSDIAGFGAGELELQRLSTIADSYCDPNLGGEGADDHGDTWQTGTFLTDLEESINSKTGTLEEKGDVDVFRFTLSSSDRFTCYTHASRGTDSVGILYEIVNNVEVEIVESDEHPSNDAGFWIEEELKAGRYSLHVVGKDDRETGDYEIFYKAN